VLALVAAENLIRGFVPALTPFWSFGHFLELILIKADGVARGAW
jgi:hypothetical protein